MDPERPGPRPGALSDLEAKLLAAAVGKRLFQRPAEPVQLGRYRLLGRLGQGGMSVVFRAQDPQLRREVAVKLLHSPRGQPDPEQLARLRREAHALGRLSHPNVVQVFEIGEADGQTFVVMELVRGTTLREWLRERPREPAEIVEMLAQAGRGLAAAHAAGIIHRDFKPENVLVGADGRARVVDFGLARANPGAPAETATGSLEAPLTKSGTVLGTPAFMAPEQLQDPGRADARSDQFSFCVMAHEALYGERPFEDLAAVAAGTLRPPPAGTKVPATLREPLLHGLRRDPAERWPTMDALLAALALPETAARPARRRWWLAGAGALAVLAIAGLAVPAWSNWREAEAAERALAAVEQQLAGLLADGASAAGPLVLANVADAQAGRAWARWARLLEQSQDAAAREAWAHAYVFAGGQVQARNEALLGLARAVGGRREGGTAGESGPGRTGRSTATRDGAQNPTDAPATTRDGAHGSTGAPAAPHAGGQAPAGTPAVARDGAQGLVGSPATMRDAANGLADSPATARDGAHGRADAPATARDGAHGLTDSPATTRDGAQGPITAPTSTRDGAHGPPGSPAAMRGGVRRGARSGSVAREAARVLALIAAEAPELSSAPELGPLRAAASPADTAVTPPASRDGEVPDREKAGIGPADSAAQLEQRLVDAEVPREVVALARAGLLDLSAATLLTLAGRAEPPTRARWRLAASALVAATGDDARALTLVVAAAAEPSVRDAALAEQAALLLRAGRIEEATRVLATRLAEVTPEPRPEAEALRDRLAALLAARTRLSLQFGDTDPWTAVAPAALRSDPLDRALIVDSEGGLLAAWSLVQRADRLLVELALEPSALAPDGMFVVRVAGAETAVQLELRVAAGHESPVLELRCAASISEPTTHADVDAVTRAADDEARTTGAAEGPSSATAKDPGRAAADDEARTAGAAEGSASPETAKDPARATTPDRAPREDASLATVASLGPVRGDGTHAPLRLQLDVAADALTCRVLDAGRWPALREQVTLPDRWVPGPLALELRGGEARMRVRLTELEVLGAVPATVEPPSPLARAAARLVDGDPEAAAAILADLTSPRARLWQALAAIQLARWQIAGASLERVLTDESGLAELQRWLRADPAGLAPALRHLLGEPRWLDLFARAWQRELDAPQLAPDVVRLVLAELAGLDARCGGAHACAALHQAHGRALVQIGEPVRARRAFEAALAAAPEDADGRALARQLVLDLALVGSP
ncbi:serine/threonine-protein kinase [Nannocystis radixulma]|uniref:Protein kinase n=1 Tax=Nannocystis radixulma TaxID=2995305 RepID=A0ABT5AXL8_9BACT|nr:serine/threonine-protein kinase [Nannocystis radixulma]MDC0666228.1 protein kinase [Nannocystis radixulma]